MTMAGIIGIVQDGILASVGTIGVVIFGMFPMAGADGMTHFGILFGEPTGVGTPVGDGTPGPGMAGGGEVVSGAMPGVLPITGAHLTDLYT